jgi:hypothetical protein
MTVQKIQSGRIITQTADEFVGNFGTLFYNESLGDLRLGDGVTPGGRPLNLGGGTGTSISYTLPAATSSTLGGIKVGSNLSISPDGTLNATGGGSSYPSFGTIQVSNQSNLTAVGNDTLQFIAGPGMIITTNNTPNKTITFESTIIGVTLDGGLPGSVYGGLEIIDGGGV